MLVDCAGSYEIYSVAVSALETGNPYSYIRCGDGEGHFLQFLTEEFSIRTMAWRLNFFFGTQDISLHDIRRISSGMSDALRDCDRLGINQRYSYRQICDKAGSMQSDANGYAGLKYLYEYVEAAGYSDKVVSAHLPYNMLLNGDLYRLIDKARTVVLVTGRKSLDRLMKQVFGCKFESIHLDEEFKFSNRKPNRRFALSDLLDELCGRVDQYARPGVLVLIGAGPIGKGLCARAAHHGAVAIDCGAIFDAMVGLNTRDYFSQAGRRWPDAKILEDESPLLLSSANVRNSTRDEVTPVSELTGRSVIEDAQQYWSAMPACEDSFEAPTIESLMARSERLQNEINAIKRSRAYRAMIRLGAWRRRLSRA